MGTLTNTQAAYRLPQYHEGFLDRLNERAKNLFADGYTTEPCSADGEFYVWPPRPYELPYTVDAINRTCTCDFFQKQYAEPLREDGGFVECKHLRGLSGLVRSQREEVQLEAEQAHRDSEGELESRLLESLRQLRAAWEVAQNAYCRRLAA